MRIAIIGTGYVGLVTGACFAKLGHTVVCLDKDQDRIKSLVDGEIPFFEPKLKELVKYGIENKKLSFSDSYQKTFIHPKKFNAVFLCVGTPPKSDRTPDLSFLKKSVHGLGSLIKYKLPIFIKSTVPAGTNKLIEEYYSKSFENENLIFASNPEFLREGNAVNDFMKAERIVVGTDNNMIRSISKKIYSKLINKKTKLVLTNIASAELIKYASNAFLATKISFINEISRLCDYYGADINDLEIGMGLDSRIGSKFLKSGIGFGGSCFPKDLDGLIHNFEQSRIIQRVSSAALIANKDQLEYFIKKIKQNVTLKDKTIMIWGLAFKSDTDDIRESVGIKLLKRISKNSKKIYAYDELANANAAKETKSIKNVSYVEEKYINLSKCDLLIICNDSAEFRKTEIKQLKKLKLQMVFDGRNILNKKILAKAGIRYFGIGN